MAKGGSRSSTSTRQDVNTTNINLQDNDGVTILGSNNQVLDFGAVEASFEFAGEVAGIGADTFESSLRFARDAAETSAGVVDRSFDFADRVVDVGADTVQGVIGDAFSLTTGVVDDALGFVSQQNQRSVKVLADQVDRTVAGIQQFANEQSESTADQITEFGMIALFAVVVIVVAPKLLKG